jgi:hypothetical protein
MLNSGKVSNYGFIISEKCRQRRKLFIRKSLYTARGRRSEQQRIYVVSEGKIIQPPATTVSQVESERTIYMCVCVCVCVFYRPIFLTTTIVETSTGFMLVKYKETGYKNCLGPRNRFEVHNVTCHR